MNKEKNKLGRPTDGLLRQNVVLMSGLVISPVAAGATTFENALLISVGFSLITFISILLCRFIPRKIAYTVRIIAYAVVASAVYIPVAVMLEKLFSASALVNVGIYLPILITNPVILSKTETRFYLRPYHIMVLEILGYIAGFTAPCLLIGIIRDVVVNSSISWTTVDFGFTAPALETTFGGFILIGILAGMFRALYSRSRKKKESPAREEKV